MLVTTYLKYKPTLPALSIGMAQGKPFTNKPGYRLWGLLKLSLSICLLWMCMCKFLIREIASFFFQEFLISCYLWHLSAILWVCWKSSTLPSSFCCCSQQPPDIQNIQSIINTLRQVTLKSFPWSAHKKTEG